MSIFHTKLVVFYRLLVAAKNVINPDGPDKKSGPARQGEAVKRGGRLSSGVRRLRIGRIRQCLDAIRRLIQCNYRFRIR